MAELIFSETARRDRHHSLELRRYRELFKVSARRDLSVHNKRTATIFAPLVKLPSDRTAPYPLMVFAKVLVWTFIG
jgi:hypothetical protein